MSRATARLALTLSLVVACARSGPPPASPPPPSAMPSAASAPAPAAPPPPSVPPPAAAPAPAREPAPAPPPATAPRPSAPATLRVGLATDLPSVEIPCCGAEVVAELDGRPLASAAPLRVEPDVDPQAAGGYRLQAAALKDERQARGLAARLAELAGGPADVVFDAGSDLYRVRVGRYAGRDEAEAAGRRLAAAGVESFVIDEPQAIAEPAMRLIQGGRTTRVEGRWLAFRPREGDGLRVAGGRYRGRLLVHLNRRGTLNLINEVDFEDYLRGVVPREMGPEVFDDLEALKAQTVAARTYTLRNLGEFAGEGYDICATPRCQVYGGMEVEHPLSDRAVRETAGEVMLFENQLVDALYSSTCGGHTENAEVVFPAKQAPYLRGVPCLEAGVDRLGGDLERGRPFPAALTRRLLPPTGGAGATRGLAARLEHLALLAGLPVPDDTLASLERREVQRFIASLFDLALDARLFVAAEDLPYLLDKVPAGWSEEDLRLAAYLMRSGLLRGDLEQPLAAGETEETLFRLALFLRVLEEREARYLSAGGGELRVRVLGEPESLTLPGELATFRRLGDEIASGPLALLAGDRLTLYLAADELLAVVQTVDSDGVSFDRTSNRSSWTRFRSDAELAELARARYPGLELGGFELLSRGVSGRVGHLRLLGTGGEAVDVQGLAVRWTLDLPDTLFTAKRLEPAAGAPGWLFSGRGWGHGVGLCQVGAYGMAVRGHGYHEILHHYYSGVRIERLSPAGPDSSVTQ